MQAGLQNLPQRPWGHSCVTFQEHGRIAQLAHLLRLKRRKLRSWCGQGARLYGTSAPMQENPERSDLKEFPVPGPRLDSLQELHGLATDKAVREAWWCGLDIDHARPHLLRVARQVLTDKQLEIFEPWLSGEGIVSIAERLGVTHQVVSKSLNGRSEKGGIWYNGSLAKLRVHLIEDDAFIMELVRARAVNGPMQDTHSDLRGWFKSLRSSTLHQFIPRVVLLMAHAVCDTKREVTFSQLYEYLPRPVVSEGIPVLKGLGYIHTDGIRIRLIRTPLEEI